MKKSGGDGRNSVDRIREKQNTDELDLRKGNTLEQLERRRQTSQWTWTEIVTEHRKAIEGNNSIGRIDEEMFVWRWRWFFLDQWSRRWTNTCVRVETRLNRWITRKQKENLLSIVDISLSLSLSSLIVYLIQIVFEDEQLIIVHRCQFHILQSELTCFFVAILVPQSEKIPSSRTLKWRLSTRRS